MKIKAEKSNRENFSQYDEGDTNNYNARYTLECKQTLLDFGISCVNSLLLI